MQSSLEEIRARIEAATAEEAQKLAQQLLTIRQQRFRSNPVSFFKAHPKQLPFFQSQAQERWIYAANQFGKTLCGAVETVYWATGHHPYRKVPEATFGWVVSLDYNVQRDVIQPKLQSLLPPGRVADTTYRVQNVWDQVIMTCFRCGAKPRESGSRKSATQSIWMCPRCGTPCSVIGFKSQDQGQLKFQGAVLDYIWEDEEGDKGIHEECGIRLIKRKGSRWGTMTPVHGQTWTYDEILMNAEAQKAGTLEVFTGTMYDNLSMDPKRIALEESKIKDEAMRRIRFYGECRTLSGLIFKMWDPALHEVDRVPEEFITEDGKIQEGFDVYCGIDTGRHFAATFWLCDYFGNLWGFAEHFATDQSLRENARAIHGICRQYDISPIYVLDATSQFQVDLAEEGIPCTKTADGVDVGIELMIQYMSARRESGGHPMCFVVKPNMPEWIRERARYQWDAPAKSGAAAGAPKNKPMKKDDHSLDSSRYVFQLRPTPSQLPAGSSDRSIMMQMRDRVQRRIQEREMAREGSGGVEED